MNGFQDTYPELSKAIRTDYVAHQAVLHYKHVHPLNHNFIYVPSEAFEELKEEGFIVPKIVPQFEQSVLEAMSPLLTMPMAAGAFW